MRNSVVSLFILVIGIISCSKDLPTKGDHIPVCGSKVFKTKTSSTLSDTITLASAPLLYESYDQFKLSSFFPSVIEVRVVNPGGSQPYLFVYDHRSIACDLAKSFWNASSWVSFDEVNNPRSTKFKKTYIYTLSDEDFI